ncbi:MAG: von Willebrand factor type A domain-containing protein [Bifidobacteriaceae bacterium]|jgi:Ca-activated chloride channel family protein|nr:von Willebrand factor type A domain-containing protein [Bifidobacteriaceae bacterium]
MNNSRRFRLAAIAGLSVAALIGGCASSDDTGLASLGDSGAMAANDGSAGADQDPVTSEAVAENDWVDVAVQPISTFSSDVDTASYSMLRYLLNSGQFYAGMQEAIRIEEMLNYFDYGYQAPDADAERPFNVEVKVAAAPWNPSHQLAQIGVKAKEARPATEGNNVVLLLDTSGSMSHEDKLPLLVESFKLLAEQLGERDRISVITYAGGHETLLEGVTGDKADQVIDALESLTADGSTAGADALAEAYDLAAEHFIEGGNNRILLATDGDFNVGPSSVEELTNQITEARGDGVFISVFGFGIHSHDALMEAIADNGNGNYFYIDNLKEARRALADQFDSTMFTVAKDLKLQVEFNPAEVAQYRLIGYENRVLANEDFEDDLVDAGDVGAGATVTALYELVPSPAEQEDAEQPATVEPGTWMTVSTRYKDPDGTESKQDDFPAPIDAPDVADDDDWRWAAAVAEFGLILRDSQHKGEATLEQVKSLAGGALGEDPYGLRAEFLELVDLYADSI